MESSTDWAEWSGDDLQQDVSEAAWVNNGLKCVPETTVGSLVPTVFDAYARILCPDRASEPHPTRAKPVAPWHVQLASIIAGYDYFLLRGPVSRAADTLEGLSPNLWWPADRAWCVAQHFDFPCAYLGGSTNTVADLLALTEIESSPVRVDQIITVNYDQHND